MPTENNFAKTSMVFQAGENLDFLSSKLARSLSPGRPVPSKIMVVCPTGKRAKILAKISSFSPKPEVVEVHSLRHDLPPLVTTPYLAYLPANAPYSHPPLGDLDLGGNAALFLQPWIPPVTLGVNEWARLVYMDFGWISTPALFQKLSLGESWTLHGLENAAQRAQVQIPYLSTPACAPLEERIAIPKGPPKLSMKSRVLALVPHYQCEEWLEQCLDSLVRQTRPPQAIAVLDDGSAQPPLGIVQKFPRVTLLRSPQNTGPYRLVQSAIGQTHFDAYMFQDADDWSSLDRLERQLREAERTGAEWIGAQELMYFDDSIHAARFPLVVNPALKAGLRNSFCHPSSLISRDLVMRLGGFAPGLRFSGDFEFLSRAVWAGKVANLDRYAYFQRIRRNSLITSEETGLASTARQKVDFQILKRTAENHVRADQGLPPLLEPLWAAEPVIFEHLAGPPPETAFPSLKHHSPLP